MRTVPIYGKISVAVCDPCPLIFSGLKSSFHEDARILIATESASLRFLAKKVAAGEIDIALVDWSMISWYDHQCMQMVRQISTYSLLVLLGSTESTQERKAALDFGARGIISKRSSLPQIRKALCRVAQGGIWLEKAAAETLLDHVFLPSGAPYDEQSRIESLTRREREVVSLVCRSLKNKEIASILLISESTVWHHLTSIFGKLQVADRVSLVTFAFRHNLSTYIDKPMPAPVRRLIPMTLPTRAGNAREPVHAADPETLTKISA
jgi:two-component system, NarL family, nitrate/nitrite response regulator NarL